MFIGKKRKVKIASDFLQSFSFSEIKMIAKAMKVPPSRYREETLNRIFVGRYILFKKKCERIYSKHLSESENIDDKFVFVLFKNSGGKYLDGVPRDFNEISSQLFATIKKNAKKREHQIEFNSISEFRSFLLSRGFSDIYEQWKSSGWLSEFKPSIDRKNDNLGYLRNNIYVTTLGLNDSKNRFFYKAKISEYSPNWDLDQKIAFRNSYKQFVHEIFPSYVRDMFGIVSENGSVKYWIEKDSWMNIVIKSSKLFPQIGKITISMKISRYYKKLVVDSLSRKISEVDISSFDEAIAVMIEKSKSSPNVDVGIYTEDMESFGCFFMTKMGWSQIKLVTYPKYTLKKAYAYYSKDDNTVGSINITLCKMKYL